MNIVETLGLAKTYKKGHEKIFAINGIDLTFERGEFLSIVGPSGSGKTTLLNLIGCLDAPTSGSIRLEGVDVSSLNENQLKKIRQNSLGFVFQHFSLIPTLTVLENIELPLLFSKRKAEKVRIESILKIIGLMNRKDHLPQQLSSGEMQRVAIGRAMVNKPKIILADEPTGNLDSITAGSIYNLFKDLNQEGLTIIVVTHNLELAGKTDRIIQLKDGRIVSEEP
ncbi:MAG: ABC transporter ATP-binding protein [Thermodesulfobacteriota bacterium]|nr:ABC transporter ATP-binding protein [Thermodesulfobacteriota bacterium]